MIDAELRERLLTTQRRYLQAILAIAAVVAIIVLTVLGVVWVSLEKAEEQRQLIVSCTTPSGECFKRNNARTNEVVGSINDVSIAAAACGAAHPGDVKATESCVRLTLQPLKLRKP